MSDTNTVNPLKELEDLYKNKEYESYKDKLIENRSLFSEPEYFYNLGTAYLKLGNYGASRLNLEKAKKYGYRDVSVENNIDYVKKEIKIENFDTDFIVNAKSLMPDYYIVFSLALILFVFLLNLKFKFKKISLLVLCLLSLSPMIFNQIYLEKNYKNAIVVKASKVFEGPSSIFESNQEVVEGQRVITSKISDKWHFIYWPNKFKGWVKVDTIEFY